MPSSRQSLLLITTLALTLVVDALIAKPARAAPVPPTVTLTGVASGATVSGTLTLGATTSNSAVEVKWYVDGVEAGWDGSEPWSVAWNSKSVADGAHQIQARAADVRGSWGASQTVSFTVKNVVILPGVTVTAPAAGTSVAGTTTLSATASDPSGIRQLKWYVDGREVGWDGAAPWSVSWNTATVGDGTHTMFAKAENGLGTWLTSATASFSVHNGNSAPPPPPPPPPVSSKWQLMMSDNFDGSTLDSTKWRIYGPNWKGHNGNGLRDGRAVSIQNGRLTITARMIDGVLVSGGVASRIEQAYGRYEFIARADPDPSQAMSGVVLTWPESNNFPIDGENDIWETLTEPDRNPLYSFIHYGSQNWQYWYHHYVDGTQWHRMAMEWEPNAIRIYRNGALVWTVSDSSAIPDVRHHLCVQLDAFKTWVSGAPRIEVDEVRIYKRLW